MDSAADTLAGRFPHSEIPGSKLVCQLPGAYRRLPRPSSPVIAKASTTCTYSLDPITLSPRVVPEVPLSQVNSCLPASGSFCAPDASIQSNPVLDSFAARRIAPTLRWESRPLLLPYC